LFKQELKKFFEQREGKREEHKYKVACFWFPLLFFIRRGVCGAVRGKGWFASYKRKNLPHLSHSK
jgi:hypothetical protein